MSRCAPTRAWAVSAPCGQTPAGKDAASRFRPVQFFGKHGDAGRGDARSPGARTRSACTPRMPATRWRVTRSTAMRHSTASCARSASSACSCTQRASASRGRQGGEFSVNTPLPPELAAVLERLATRPSGRASQAAALTAGDSPRSRSAPQSQISGRPMRALGSCSRCISKSAIPKPSALKPPAQSKGCSRST